MGAEVYHAEDIYAWNPNYITEAHMKKVGGGYTVLPFDQMPTPWTKAILQQHDFPFGVNSTVGKGSTFWFEMKAPQ